jgi:SAM-dependent methyltransferase
MKFTGERPTLEHEFISSRMRYKIVIPYCHNKKVLDFGCGVGHGTYLLSVFTSDILGYDCDKHCIEEAQANFKDSNIDFTNAWSPKTLKSRDLVISIECIEHLEKEDLVSCISLCSKHVPTFLCTTPNGDIFPYHPKNLSERRGFHVWHYTYDELNALFSRFYKFVDISGHAFDPKIQRFTGYTVFATNSLKKWNNEFLTKIKV